MNLTEGDWLKIRESILRRDKFKCVECGKPCNRGEADIHHLLPRSAGGSDEPSNLITLCDGCHAAHHPKLAAGLARRAIERWAVTPRRREGSKAAEEHRSRLKIFLSAAPCVGKTYRMLQTGPFPAQPTNIFFAVTAQRIPSCALTRSGYRARD
jgi:HNH endonuclease